MKKREEKKKGDKEIVLAKYTFIGSIIIAVLGLIGTAVTAYFGYLSNHPANQSDTPQIALPTSTNPITDIPSVTPVFTSTNFPVPSSTATLSSVQIAQNATNELQRDPSTGYYIIYPSCNCAYSVAIYSSHETFLMRLRWGAKNAELAERGANLLSYSLSIDEKNVSNLEKYRKPAILVKSPTLKDDQPNTWYVYWDYPMTLSDSSDHHTIQLTLTTLSAIDNGWNIIPAGVTDNFQTTIDVYEVYIK